MKIDKITSARMTRLFAKSNGFTLIELMVVVAIMAILTMVAYPSYQDSIRRSRRTDAIAAALTIQAAQEKFRANCQVYAGTFDTTAPIQNDCVPGVPPAPPTGVIVADQTSPEGYYAMSLSGATGNAYIITATPQGAQADDGDCDPMVLTFSAGEPNGVKTPAICWP